MESQHCDKLPSICCKTMPFGLTMRFVSQTGSSAFGEMMDQIFIFREVNVPGKCCLSYF